jgi:hypothetical protein
MRPLTGPASQPAARTRYSCGCARAVGVLLRFPRWQAHSRRYRRGVFWLVKWCVQSITVRLFVFRLLRATVKSFLLVNRCGIWMRTLSPFKVVTLQPPPFSRCSDLGRLRGPNRMAESASVLSAMHLKLSEANEHTNQHKKSAYTSYLHANKLKCEEICSASKPTVIYRIC